MGTIGTIEVISIHRIILALVKHLVHFPNKDHIKPILRLEIFVLHRNFELGYNFAWVTFTLKLLQFDLPHLREKLSSFIHPFGCNLDFDIFLVLEVHLKKFLIAEEDNYPPSKIGTHAYLHVGFLFY